MAEAAPPSNPHKPKSAPQRAMEKLGLLRDIDLALHLPLRYEDETKLVPIAALRDGDHAQVEGVVTDSRVQFRPRRQLDEGAIDRRRTPPVEQARRAALGRRMLRDQLGGQREIEVGKRVGRRHPGSEPVKT